MLCAKSGKVVEKGELVDAEPDTMTRVVDSGTGQLCVYHKTHRLNNGMLVYKEQ